MRSPFCSFLWFGFIALLASDGASAGALKLPALISDHMVLQRDAMTSLWGQAEPGASVSVSLGTQSKITRADQAGKWRISLDPISAGGALTLTIRSADDQITIHDVLVGEVWIGAGQSNMGFPFKMNFFPYLKVKDYEQEKAAANFPEIRMFIVETAGVASSPQEDCRGKWLVTTPENVDEFSAVLFFFGRELHQSLRVPVGLIKSAVGGTGIELWNAAEAQRAEPALAGEVARIQSEKDKFDAVAAETKYQSELAAWLKAAEAAKAEGKQPPRKPGDPVALAKRNFTLGGLFNSKIAPLVPFTIRGVIWYQGENNCSSTASALCYGTQLSLLVTDWRRRWGTEFPFAWVQLANLENENGNWPIVREAMLQTLRLPKTGMAVAIDVGEPHNIHPIDKQTVGHRLALWALGDVYGRDTATSGPLPLRWERRGRDFVVTFSHADGGLSAKGGELRGFVIAGADGGWKPAAARIEDNSVLVSSPEVTQPRAMRYAWAGNPDCNLYNGAGLPASPFRTDTDSDADLKQ